VKRMTKQQKLTEFVDWRIAWPHVHVNLPWSKDIRSC